MSYATPSNSPGNPRVPRAESIARTRCSLRLSAPRPGDAAAAFLGEHSTQSAVAFFTGAVHRVCQGYVCGLRLFLLVALAGPALGSVLVFMLSRLAN